MKKVLILFSVLFFLSACSTKDVYEGRPLIIGYLGDIPEIEIEQVEFQEVHLNEVKKHANALSEKYDALWVTPTMFDELSDDQYVSFFHELSIPTAFIDSRKGHHPFVTKDLAYDTGFDLDNGSHSTLYFNYGGPENREEAWYFYSHDDHGNEKKLLEIYTEILYQIENIN